MLERYRVTRSIYQVCMQEEIVCDITLGQGGAAGSSHYISPPRYIKYLSLSLRAPVSVGVTLTLLFSVNITDTRLPALTGSQTSCLYRMLRIYLSRRRVSRGDIFQKMTCGDF